MQRSGTFNILVLLFSYTCSFSTSPDEIESSAPSSIFTTNDTAILLSCGYKTFGVSLP
jgi:hypothetical protein